MERDTTPPPSAPRTPKDASSPESERFFNRWRQKAKKQNKQSAESQKPAAPESQGAPAEKPAKQRFGANILRFLKRDAKPEQATATPEVPAAEKPEAPEVQPAVENAQRVRRFARVVLAHVFGEAKAEPARASKRSEEAIDTQPLFVAAEDLQEATETLDSTLRVAKEDRVFMVSHDEARPSAGREVESAEPARPFADYRASERIAEQVAKLESQAETSKSFNVLAIGLGVIAVIVAGHEHRARKRSERQFAKERVELTSAITGQQRELQEQKQAFNELRQEKTASMDRAHRQEYYERLGELTHQQADTARQVDRELQQAIAPRQAEQTPSRSEWQPRQPSFGERPAPVVTVERADTIERGPSRQNDMAGTGGGATGGVGGQTNGQPTSVPSQAPLSPAALRAQAQRKARAARLASSAWLYGTLLMLAIAAFVVAMVVLG